ncbi:MAG: hypothetical protein ACRC3Y_07160 [Romboutsia sp.]|uniref:YfjL-like protein n=1 Tax=Romboutsia sp. TaxID=1965302 RepID=UPI003F415F29
MKKSIKILSGVTAFLLIIGILYFANGLVGNPISKMMANKEVKELVNEKYSNLDLELEDARYNFKIGGYDIIAKSPNSRDTHFTISTNQFGKIYYDSYENDVVNRYNTFFRINSAYGERVMNFFDNEKLQYKTDINFGEIMSKEESESDEYSKIKYGVVLKDLELDKEYDMHQLGKEYGHIVFYAQDEDVSVNKASEILLYLKNILDEEKIYFYAIDFVLEKPRGENNEVKEESRIDLKQFLYEDIYEEDLENRVIKVMEDTKKYYEEQDKEKLEQEIKINEETKQENKNNK